MVSTQSEVLSNIFYGIAFGYSSCCVEYFHIRQFNGDMFKDMQSQTEKKLTGTGFICCPTCEANFSEKELISNINKNRYFSNKFPEDNDNLLNQELVDMLLGDPVVKHTISSVSYNLSKFVKLENDLENE